MRIIFVVVADPSIKRLLEFKRILPCIGPDKVFFDGSQNPLGTCVSFGIIVARKNLSDAQQPARRHKADGSRLAAVIADKAHLFFLANPGY